MEKNKHSEAIKTMGIIVLIVGIILAIILGCIYKVATAKSASLYNYDYDCSFNWGLAITVAVSDIFCSLFFFATAHIAAAIEEISISPNSDASISTTPKTVPNVSAQIKCPNCGATNSSHDYTCKECGSGLK